MPNPRFDLEDLDDGSTPTALKEAILDLMLSWPKLEYGLVCWIAFALQVTPSETAIALGAMSNRNKIERLKALYTHRDDAEASALLKQLAKEHQEFSRIRNTIAHALLLGASKGKPDAAYFLSTRAVPDERGFMEVARIDMSSFQEARTFALARALSIRSFLQSRGADVD